jgi:transposase
MSENDKYYYKDGFLLFKRLKEHVDQHLAFIQDFDVPYSNNLVERDFRNTKTKMKISGCFKNLEHAAVFTTIRIFIQTCVKRKLNT